jgi:hypothetical protein
MFSRSTCVMLCLSNYVTETIQVTDGRKYFLEGSMQPVGRILASPGEQNSWCEVIFSQHCMV